MSLRTATPAIALALMGGIFAADYVAGHEIDLWLLYLVPIGLVSFVLGALYGYAATLAVALLLLATTMIYHQGVPSVLAFLSERGTEATVYVMAVYLIGLLRLALIGRDVRQPLDTPTHID